MNYLCYWRAKRRQRDGGASKCQTKCDCWVNQSFTWARIQDSCIFQHVPEAFLNEISKRPHSEKNNPPLLMCTCTVHELVQRGGVHIVFRHQWVSVWKVKVLSRVWYVASACGPENTPALRLGPDTHSWRPNSGQSEKHQGVLQPEDQSSPLICWDL